MAASPLFIIPNSLAIAFAVRMWSPVIITVLIPAAWQFATASFTPFLGGSIMPIKPTKTKSFSILLLSIVCGNAVISL